MICTGYFAKLKQYNALGLTAISIARWSPKWWAITACEPRLAPSANLLQAYKQNLVDEAEYERIYTEELKKIDVESIIKELEGINPKGVVLCCYEKSDSFCHRHILSKYVNSLHLLDKDMEEVRLC